MAVKLNTCVQLINAYAHSSGSYSYEEFHQVARIRSGIHSNMKIRMVDISCKIIYFATVAFLF